MSEAYDALVAERAKELEDEFYSWLADSLMRRSLNRDRSPLAVFREASGGGYLVGGTFVDPQFAIMRDAAEEAFVRHLRDTFGNFPSLDRNGLPTGRPPGCPFLAVETAARAQAVRDIREQALRFAAEHPPRRKVIVRSAK